MTFSTGILRLTSALVILEQHTISTESRGKKTAQAKIYNLSNHHFMNYSCQQRNFTHTGDEV